MRWAKVECGILACGNLPVAFRRALVWYLVAVAFCMYKQQLNAGYAAYYARSAFD